MTLRDAVVMLEEATRSINAGDRQWLDKFYHPAAVFHGGGADLHLDDARRWWAGMWEAFPDLRYHGEIILVGEDGFTNHWSISGTHTGPYLGRSATGRRFSMWGVTAMKVRGGKITEEWAALDALGLQVQLGMVPGQG